MDSQQVADLLAKVQHARNEGWYEDNPGWQEIDSALSRLGYPVERD